MRVIAFVTRKGGSGKSTLAINIAVAAEARGERVLMLDCDAQQTLSKWAERRVAETPLFETIDSPAALSAALKFASNSSFTLAIIDTPGFDTPIVSDAIKSSDFCIVPTRPTTADIEAMATVLQSIRALDKPFAFVINQALARGGRTEEAANGLLALGNVSPAQIYARVSLQDALGTGLGITEFQASGKAATEMRNLWKWLDSRVGRNTECNVL